MNQDLLCLKPEIRLRNLAAIAVAVNLWETPKVKNEIKKFKKEIENKDIAGAYNDGRTWCRIGKVVLDQVPSLNVALELASDVEKLILLVGDKIFLWVVYVTKEFLFKPNYSEKIYWTINGRINENKIYKDWRQDKNFQGIDDFYKNKIALFSIAAFHADEKFIRENLKTVAELAVFYTGLKIKDISKFKVNSAITILLISYFAARSHTLSFKLLYSSLKSQGYPNGTDIMFFYCAIYGFEKAAEYFYNKLKKEDKVKMVIRSAVEMVTYASSNINFNYEKSRLPESLLYLLDKLPSQQKKQFLTKEIVGVHTILLFTWPYQEFCIQILDYVWDDLPLPKRLAVLDATFEMFKKFSGNRNDVYKSVFQPVLYDILVRFPEDFFKKDNLNLDNYL